MEERIETYLKALEADPFDISAIISLEEIYTQQKRWEELVALYRKEAETIKNPLYSSLLRWKMGDILSKKLSNDAGAVTELKKALELDSHNTEALKTLREICVKTGRWEESLALLRTEAEAAHTPEERGAALFRIGSILLEKVQDADKGVEELEKAFALDPKNTAIAEALEKAYRQRTAWKELAALLEKRASMAHDQKDAVSLYYRAGRLWMEKTADTAQAISCFGRALAGDPAHMEAMKALREILVHENRWSELPDALEKEAEHLKESIEAHSVRFMAGEIRKERLADPEKAITSFLRVLKSNPHHVESLNAMEDILLQFGRWKEIIPVLERQLERGKDPRQSVAYRLRIGLIWKNRLNNPDKAILCFLKVLELDPLHRTALRALDDTLTQNGRWEELVPVVEKLAETSQDPQEYMDLYMRLAHIWDEKLKNKRKAVECYQKVLSKEPTNLPALKALESICLREKDWKSLIRVLEKEAEAFQNPKEAMAMYLWIGEICHTHLSDIEGAISAYTRALVFAPNDVPTLRTLETLLSLKGSYEDVIKINKKLLKATDDPNEQILLHFTCGEIYEKNLRHPDEAVECYRKVLSLAPIHFGALSALERIYREKGEWGEIVKIIEARAQAQDDPRETASLDALLGDIYEHTLKSDEKAVSSYSKAMTLDQDNAQAFEGLKRLFTTREAWAELAQLLEKGEERLTLPEERSALLYRAGVLYEDRLSQPDKAHALYQRALEITPAHFPSLLALERLYVREEKWEALQEVYKKELSLTTDQRRMISLYHKMAETLEDRLGRQDDAVALYNKILDLDPANRTAIHALASLYKRTENWEAYLHILKLRTKLAEKKDDLLPIYSEAGAVYLGRLNLQDRAREAIDKVLEIDPNNADALITLDEFHARQGNWKELLDVLHRRLKVTKDPNDQASLYYRTGEVWEEHQGNKKEAVLCYEKVLELNPGHFLALRALERLYSQRERWEDLIRVMSREAELRADDSQSVSIHLRMANIAETKLMQRERAEGIYRTILAKDQANHKALTALSSLLRTGGKWGEFVDVLRKLADLAPGPAESFPLFLEMAEVCKNRLNDGNRALSFYKDVLRIDPTCLAAFEGMHSIYKAAQKWEDMVRVLEEEIMLTADQAKKVELLTEMGTVLDQKLAKKKEAIHCYEQALSAKPDHLPVLEPLASYYMAASMWDRASQVLDTLITLERDPKKKLGHLTSVAKIWQEGLHDPLKATRYYEEALSIEPAHVPSLEALASIYEAKNDWDNLSKTYHRAIDLFTKSDPSKALPFHVSLGKLYKTHLGSEDRAMSEFQKAVRIDPFCLSAHVSLAEIYKKNPQTKNEYLREHMSIIRIDPSSSDSARTAGRVYEDQKQFDRAYCLYTLIELFKSEDKMERLFIDSNRPKVPHKGKKPLDEEMRDKLLTHPSERNAVRRFLRALDEQAASAYPPSLERYGNLKKLEGFFQSSAPSPQFFQDIMDTLGAGAVTVLVSDGAMGSIGVENTSPPSIIVSPKAFEGLTQDEARFLIGRAVEIVGGRYILSRKIPPGELWEFLLAVARGLELEVDIPGKNEDTIQKRLKDAKKVIGRKNRKIMEEAAKEFIKVYKKFDLQAHLKAQSLTANRAGLLASNDLAASLSALAKSDKRFSQYDLKNQESLKRFLSESVEAKDLVQFGLSDDYFILRSRLGLSLLSV